MVPNFDEPMTQSSTQSGVTPPMDKMTDDCKNITFLQLLFAGGINCLQFAMSFMMMAG